MSKYTYNFKSVQPQSIVEQDGFSVDDSSLLESFEVNTGFNQVTDYIELHYYTLDGRLLKSFEDYTNIQSPQDSEVVNKGTLSTIGLRTEDDLKIGGYEAGDVYLYYNFLSDPYSDNKSKVPFFIEEIAPDRFEVRLLTTKLENSKVKEYTDKFKTLLNESDSENFYLNFSNNRLLLATNIDTLVYNEYISVVIRLYNPLPEDIEVKKQLTISSPVSNTVAYLATATIIPEEEKKLYLKGPNFNTDEGKTTSSPTQYLSIEDVFNYPVNNSYYEVRSKFEEKGVNLSVDYSDFTNFINFSSAEERLTNFKYKLDLITSYQSQSDAASNVNSYSTSSVEYYDGLINTVISNFDHYDRYLYFESSSFSWPKSGTAKPYTPLTGSATGSWYTEYITSASEFDSSNANQLINTVPEFLREDPNNSRYATFIHMVAQHFDNLWMYAKSVTEKYNSDNRLDYGISKDLIEDALQNFGVKLYNSNKSSQELFKMFTGESFDTGSESYVDTVISGSNQVVAEEDYRRQIYKRLYHNLPLLLKSKGTERGVRTLLNSFGIPSFYSSGSHSGLNVVQLGGTVSGSFNLGPNYYVTSSTDKIRLDNTGSIEGTTLSQFTSIVQPISKYSNDINLIEAGFSPATYINNIIISSASAESFDINSILGDPTLRYEDSYTALRKKAEEYLTTPIVKQYNLKDFVRLLKFYDNVLFKTIDDFTPGRSNVNTGVIIKPHLLERSKAKQVQPSIERHNHYSSSIEIEFTTGSDGGSFGSRNQYTSSYTELIMTSGGLAPATYHSYEQAKFDGEFSGSQKTVSNGELNLGNIFKYVNPLGNLQHVRFISSGDSLPPPPTPSISPTPSITPTPSTTPGYVPPSTPSVSVTPTPTPSQGGVRVTSIALDSATEFGVAPTFRVVYTFPGYKTVTHNITSGSASETISGFLFESGTPTGTGVVNITRISPDATAAFDGDVLLGVTGNGIITQITDSDGTTSSVSTTNQVVSFTTNDTVDITYDLSGVTPNSYLTVSIQEE